MNRAQLSRRLRRLFAAQPLAVLSTHFQGQPYASLVAFCATRDLRHLRFATTRATRKFRNIVADPRVSLLIDNRSNRSEDFSAATAATAVGAARELGGPERAAAAADYLAKHPYLEDFLRAPSCALLEVDVESYVVVSRFQEVEVLELRRPGAPASP